jgi:hypothetical protein
MSCVSPSTRSGTLSGVTESAVHGHWELEPTENRNAHVDGVDFERGMANLRVALDEVDFDYELPTVETGSDHREN